MNKDISLTCPICCTKDIARYIEAKDYVTDENFFTYHCKSCSMVFVSPQPEELDKYYPTVYRKYKGSVKWLLIILYGRYVKKWTSQFEKPGSALEIGCGSGWMLKALHDQGWEVVGLERTEEEADFASKLTGLRVLSGGLDEMEPKPTYDLIILYNVLEHVTDPRETLRQCKTLLKEDGKIFLSMPNILSWQARIMKSSWFHLDLPRHLFHFSPRSLATTLELEGLEAITIKNTSLVHDLYGWVQSLLNLLGFKQNRLTRELMEINIFQVFSNPSGFVMGVTGALMFVPFLLLSAGSWFVDSGALMEVWVKKANTGKEV